MRRWSPWSEAGFVLPVFTLMGLSEEGNAEEESVPILGGPQPKGTGESPAFGTGSSIETSDKYGVFVPFFNNLFTGLYSIYRF